VNAKVDFGITSSGRARLGAQRAIHVRGRAVSESPLIAKIEDPSYLLMAVKADSGITDLSQIAAQKLPATDPGRRSPVSQPNPRLLRLDQEAVGVLGRLLRERNSRRSRSGPALDVVITENASPANNPEAAY